MGVDKQDLARRIEIYNQYDRFVGAISLFYWLLRYGAAANVARLFFLVPASTAVMAALMFGETIDAIAVTGMVLIGVAVVLARAPA